MRVSAENFLTQIGTWADAETDLTVMPLSIEFTSGKWKAHYAVNQGEQRVGEARFNYVPECDTVFFVTIELDPTVANQGFMTRWLAYGGELMTDLEVRRASSNPIGYAAQVFENAGWLPNVEDGLGAVCYYYSVGSGV